MHDEKTRTTVELVLDERGMPRIAGLLSGGVGVGVAGPCGLDTFLGEILGLDPVYIRDRLRTIFVNGQPVDDIAHTMLAPGDELALSVAMPGLVGICMRLDSPFKSFRGDITHGRAASRSHLGAQAGTVTVKLFNFIAREIGPGLLARGVAVSGGRLARAVADGEGVVAARYGDADCGVAELAAQLVARPDAAYFVRAAQNTP